MADRISDVIGDEVLKQTVPFLIVGTERDDPETYAQQVAKALQDYSTVGDPVESHGKEYDPQKFSMVRAPDDPNRETTSEPMVRVYMNAPNPSHAFMGAIEQVLQSGIARRTLPNTPKTIAVDTAHLVSVA